MVGALGGRAAEQLVYGDITTGAESDLEQATRIARQMVGRWGMSERDRPGLGAARPRRRADAVPGHRPPSSEQTRELVDEEVRRIIEESETHRP